MGHILSKVFPFLGSVFAHWQIWLSGGGIGGFIVITVALVEKIWGKSLPKKTYVYLFLIAFFLCSCFLSWVDKDDALNSEAQKRVDDNSRNGVSYGKLQVDFGSLVSQCQYKSGVIDTLVAENRSQQNSINNCQTGALKLLAPVPLSIKLVPLDGTKTFDPDKNEKVRSARWLAITNRTFATTSLAITCDKWLVSGDADMAGGATFMGPVTLVSPHQLSVKIYSPAWAPDRPVVIDMKYKGQDVINCGIQQD